MDQWPSKDPNSIEPFHIIWCDPTGINTGAAADNGELQGATISSATFTVPTGLTQVSSNTLAVTIHGTAYAVNTVATVWLSGGTEGVTYSVLCRITTSDGRTLDKSVLLPVKSL